MSKRGSGSSARTGDVREVFSGMKEAMEPFEKNFPKLEGTEKKSLGQKISEIVG